MLWSTGVIGYLLVGVVTAAVTMYVFPPMEGFRPKLSTVLAAIVVFTLLWPVLVLLALWYNMTSYMRCRERAAKQGPTQEGLHGENSALQSFTVSKPR